ncbi:GNAT family N-acetyltransferase [Picosynechococcus sp. NKBG15041c]|uniref:GNAT family N-acetyltransferase n=1 Tax=Picosynechococcus sp. NKBG15041c TaxID=1407650 RepID=UPI0004071BE2|nr:GNAT family N-acetyltransferase [Picosynechococcus sp. NKBG15041c]
MVFPSQITATWHSEIAEIPKAAWDAIASPLKTPFLEWDWLHNIETSGSVGPRTGWQPCHLSLQHNGELIAMAPLYIKGHSYGEFVFDHQWADLSHRLGHEYYPKLVGMTPFTPAVGYRFLIAPGEDERELCQMMVQAIDQFCDRHGISGCNFLFVDPDWQKTMEQLGFRAWLHHGYIWSNHDFSDFDDYLGAFTSNQRKNIKRERKAVEKAGLTMKMMAGDEIPAHYFPLIYRFYSSTCDKFFWGSKYLRKAFFEQLESTYRHRVVLAAAYIPEDEKHPVGLSFCIRKDEHLYGRYWGAFDEYDCLHFEACYYKPIQWAIAQGITMYDPGAGGKHKRRRGFPATPNYSLHRFYQPRMGQILDAYIQEINAMEQQEIDAINADIPFKRRELHLDIS